MITSLKPAGKNHFPITQQANYFVEGFRSWNYISTKISMFSHYLYSFSIDCLVKNNNMPQFIFGLVGFHQYLICRIHSCSWRKNGWKISYSVSQNYVLPPDFNVKSYPVTDICFSLMKILVILEALV